MQSEIRKNAIEKEKDINNTNKGKIYQKLPTFEKNAVHINY